MNDSELKLATATDLPDEKSISRLQKYLKVNEYPNTERDIELLRTIQGLRSSGAAHTKGKNFDKIKKKANLDVESPKDVFRRLLMQVNKMLDDLILYFIPQT